MYEHRLQQKEKGRWFTFFVNLSYCYILEENTCQQIDQRYSINALLYRTMVLRIQYVS